MKKEVRKLMFVFSGSFINHNYELILVPKTNLYICLDKLETKEDLICALLEWCSRDCIKSMPYRSESRNRKYRNEVLDNLNYFLDTKFTQEDMELIYQKLGNGIRHKLTEKFVNSGFDFNVLRSDEE